MNSAQAIARRSSIARWRRRARAGWLRHPAAGLPQRLYSRHRDRSRPPCRRPTSSTSPAGHLRFLESLGIERTRVTISHPDNFAGIVELGSNENDQKLFTFKKDLNTRSLRLCSMILLQVLVYDDGKVSACACRDSEGVMEIGDLTKESFLDIRRGLRAMIQNFLDRNLKEMPLCQKCDIPYRDGWYPTLHYYSEQAHPL